MATAATPGHASRSRCPPARCRKATSSSASTRRQTAVRALLMDSSRRCSLRRTHFAPHRGSTRSGKFDRESVQPLWRQLHRQQDGGLERGVAGAAAVSLRAQHLVLHRRPCQLSSDQSLLGVPCIVSDKLDGKQRRHPLFQRPRIMHHERIKFLPQLWLLSSVPRPQRCSTALRRNIGTRLQVWLRGFHAVDLHVEPATTFAAA